MPTATLFAAATRARGKRQYHWSLQVVCSHILPRLPMAEWQTVRWRLKAFLLTPHASGEIIVVGLYCIGACYRDG